MLLPDTGTSRQHARARPPPPAMPARRGSPARARSPSRAAPVSAPTPAARTPSGGTTCCTGGGTQPARSARRSPRGSWCWARRRAGARAPSRERAGRPCLSTTGTSKGSALRPPPRQSPAQQLVSRSPSPAPSPSRAPRRAAACNTGNRRTARRRRRTSTRSLRRSPRSCTSSHPGCRRIRGTPKARPPRGRARTRCGRGSGCLGARQTWRSPSAPAALPNTHPGSASQNTRRWLPARNRQHP
mmetsp:Transcript_1678/g.4199  ORF Transcript_1678/g.4199 Transcript_1678/m.4199 type:complete len:243 (+) Transcript_1678:167-895(+)